MDSSSRIVTERFNFAACGLRRALEKSYSRLIAATARHTGRAQNGLLASGDNANDFIIFAKTVNDKQEPKRCTKTEQNKALLAECVEVMRPNELAFCCERS